MGTFALETIRVSTLTHAPLANKAYEAGRLAVEEYLEKGRATPPRVYQPRSLTSSLMKKPEPSDEDVKVVQKNYNQGRQDALAIHGLVG